MAVFLSQRAWRLRLANMSPFVIILIFACSVVALGRDTPRNTGQASTWSHLLQQAQQASNCTPPRTAADAQKPFCFVPDTVSSAAKQFLSNTSSSSFPFTVDPSTASSQEAAARILANIRISVAELSGGAAQAARQLYIQSTRNDTIAGVPVMIAVPKGVNETDPSNSKVLLYIHGGGYIFGSCHSQLGTPAVTAAIAGLTIVCPDYRLAPEHPFSAGLNDVVAVYKALLQQGYNASNMVLLGDSAGGGMAPAVAIQLQREGVALPAALGLFSPWSDMRAQGDSARTLVGIDPLFATPPGSAAATDGRLTSTASLYLGNNASLLDDPLASPVVADYAALFPNGTLPPTLIQVGLRESLLSDAVRLYHKMRAAAPAPGHVLLSPYEGMWHVFQTFFNVPEAVAASKEMADHFTRVLKGQACK